MNAHTRNFFIVFLLFIPLWANAQCVTPPSGMTAWWPGDNHANDIASNNHGTLVHRAGYATGMVGQAFTFGGVIDYVAVPDAVSLRATGSLSIDFWANFDRVPRDEVSSNGMAIIEKANDYIVWWRPDLGNGVLEFDITDSLDQLFHLAVYAQIPTLQAGQWHHFAVTSANSVGLTTPEFHIFFDGVELQTTANWQANHVSAGWYQGATGEVRIGLRATAGTPFLPFDGLIDEVEVFDRQLAPAEIQAVYDAGQSGKCKSEETPATFEVSKVFNDGNASDVEVHISCNTGLPLNASQVINQSHGVTFVVTSFRSGELDCRVWETDVPAYSVNYGDDCQTLGSCTNDETGCLFRDFSAGDTGACLIENRLQKVEVEVTKAWFDDQLQLYNDPAAQVRWFCNNPATFIPIEPPPDDEVISQATVSLCRADLCGSLNFSGASDTQSFRIYPDWKNGTTCRVEERIFDDNVESDSSDCNNLLLWPGVGASCTIESTRFYEGIPILNRNGLAVLALLMLAVGLVGFRRFI